MNKYFFSLLILFLFFGCKTQKTTVARKPVLYLYPKKEQSVSVELKFKGTVTRSVPESKNKWTIIARPNGEIIGADGITYPYILWEGECQYGWDMSAGFIVAGDSCEAFLEKTLTQLGLNEKEKKDFIEYWAPAMKKNKYTLIHFATEEYVKLANYTIVPKPDNFLRIFIVFKSVEKNTKVLHQLFKPTKRTGFTAVEWGGADLDIGKE